MRYIVRGVVSPHGANYALVGQYTYLAMSAGWPHWNQLHDAARFESREEALEMAYKASGPFFRMPDPETIETVEVKER